MVGRDGWACVVSVASGSGSGAEDCVSDCTTVVGIAACVVSEAGSLGGVDSAVVEVSGVVRLIGSAEVVDSVVAVDFADCLGVCGAANGVGSELEEGDDVGAVADRTVVVDAAK